MDTFSPEENMAKIVLHGHPKKITRQELIQSAAFFCDHLLSKRLSKNVKIVIRLKNGYYKGTDCFGSCTYTDDDARSDRHREFDIEMDSDFGRPFMLRTLAHELVHVKQYVRGQLIEMNGPYQKWNGVMFSDKKVPYKELPWEKEALRLEKELYELWKQHRDR
jgi:hypothetical protein